MSGPQFIERELTPDEVQERRIDLEALLDEQDALRSTVDEYRREIKETNVELERVTDRVLLLRREIKYRLVREPAQTDLPFRGVSAKVLRTDGPTLADEDGNPVDDPRDQDPVGGFVAQSELDSVTFEGRYPQARTHEQLRGDLSAVLSNRGERVPTLEELRQWHEATGIFSAVAYWARVELAHMNASEHPEIEIPSRQEMPKPLRELLDGKATKSRRKAK